MAKSFLALTALLLAGCWTQSGAVLERHSREYGCPASEIQLEDLGSYAIRATGCGHQVTYQCADNSAHSGTWCVPVGENTGSAPPPSAGGPPPPQTSGGQDVAVAPSTPPSPQLTGYDALRARLDERAPRILACLAAETAVIELRWGGELAVVELDVRGGSEPAVLDCARAAFGRLSVPWGTEPGELLHAISH